MNTMIRRDPLDDLLRGFFIKPMDYPGESQPPSIKMDVREQKESYLVHAEIPGVKKEDIHVVIEGNQVAISAEAKQEKELREGERVLRSERSFGQVSRAFQLGHDIDDTLATAKFNDGVLELTLPKKLVTSTRRLNIS